MTIDPQVLSVITVFLAAILSTAGAYFAAMWVNRKKVPTEVDKIKQDTNLTGTEIIEKYQSIADKQATKNLELEKQFDEQDRIHNEESEKLMNEIKKIREEMLAKDKIYEDRLSSMQEELDECKQKVEETTNYNCRLVAQLYSWNITPVPFDVERTKKEMKNGN